MRIFINILVILAWANVIINGITLDSVCIASLLSLFPISCYVIDYRNRKKFREDIEKRLKESIVIIDENGNKFPLTSTGLRKRNE